MNSKMDTKLKRHSVKVCRCEIEEHILKICLLIINEIHYCILMLPL